MKVWHLGSLVLVFTLLWACRQPPAPAVVVATAVVRGETAVPPTTTTTPTLTPAPPTATPAPDTPTAAATLPPPSPTPIPPTATATATITPDPYAPLTIAALAAREYGGGLLDIVDTLEPLDEAETFTRYLITYPSDGLTIHGYMAVPKEGGKFPVAIVLHGYIDPADYETIAYTRRYVDSLAEAGYFVIHPNFRNYPPSDSGDNPYRIGYAIDVLNLIAIIREQSQDPFGYLRRADADDINLWGHSMGGGVALRVITVNNEDYLQTAVLYASMSGDEALNYERIREWTGGANGPFEMAASPEMLQAISPIYHLDRIHAAISIHHSEADETVPIAWSNDLCAQLQTLQKPVECFTYYAIPHTFRGSGDALFMERVIRFFNQP
ncbi:MAG: alpha/beta fold hydrolase [Ardenticatenaceae bacterium]|nr:alpha/beta fold hydrolase [Ardenticatenaceae bacterium]